MDLKRLLKLLPFTFTFLSALTISAQQRDRIIQHDPVKTFIAPTQPVYDDGRTAVSRHNTPVDLPESSLLNLPGCDTLFGSLAPNNGNTGIMFNLKALQMTRVDFFNCSLSPGSGWIRLYARFGTWVSHETDLAGWALVDSVFMNVPVDSIYRIPIYVGQVLHVNETAGYYLTFTPGVSTAFINYTDGVGTINDTLYNANVTLQIFEGMGHGALFNACCSPRVFTGSVEHCPVSQNQCQAFPTTFLGGNGNAGTMFDVKTNRDIMIKGFSDAIVDSGHFKLYYRYGSYAGHQDSASHWTFVDSNYVVSAGVGVPTQLFSNLNIPLNQNESMAFYITATNDGGSIDYTDGTLEGSLFEYDGVLSFYEGLGKTYPFSTSFSPRIFNGIINYCIVPGFIGIEDNPDPEKQPSVYPVPTTGELFMDFKGVEGDRRIIITDMTGRICRDLNNQQANLIKVDVQDFSNGVYLYTVINKGQREGSGKFIKQ